MPDCTAPSENEGAPEKSRFTEEQIVTLPRKADQRVVRGIAKNHGVTAHTICAGGSTSGRWSVWT